MTATAKQIGFFHALAAKAGMDEDTRRDFLERETGVRSAKAISSRQAADVIDKLKVMAGTSGAVAGLDSPAAKKMRALWIAGYDLGLVRDRSDRAMLAFLERQAGVSHTRFLTEPGQATSAIEALKSWLARDGKVDWPPRESWKRDGKADFEEIAGAKRAVIEAQWRRVVDCCVGTMPSFIARGLFASLDAFAFPAAGKDSWADFELADFDKVQRALGRKLRAAVSKGSPQ